MKNRILAALTAILVAGCRGPETESAGPSATGSDPRLSLGPVKLVGPPSQPLSPLAATTEEGATASSSLGVTAAALVAGCSSVTLGMKVLVVSATGNAVSEPSLGAIEDALDYHGIPYTIFNAGASADLTAGQLGTGCAGNYQGVILATNDAGLSAVELSTLRAYEAGYGVRELTWYGCGSTPYGLGTPAGVDTGVAPITAALTLAGRTAFPYLNSTAPITISNAWACLSQTAGASTLLEDGSHNALVSTYTSPTDGHEMMTVTFDSNAALLHNLVLAHGYLEWLTKGVYLGQYRAYLTPQEDDIFIADDLYVGGTYRISDLDLNAFVAWQSTIQAQTGSPGFRLTHAFNGSGDTQGNPNANASTTPDATDPLITAAQAAQASFLWVNHTFSHMNLGPSGSHTYTDPVPTAGQVLTEFGRNETFASLMGFGSYKSSTFVSPDVSGLTNPKALRALAHAGVRYMITDTSYAEFANPAPNIGMFSQVEPRIYFVPRRPTNLFYNVSNPTEWAAEYNYMFCDRSATATACTTDLMGNPSVFAVPQTPAEVLENEANVQLAYLLRGDLDPHMYHQSNLRQYAGGQSLLSDLLGAAISKYRTYSNLPVQSLDLETIGARMKETELRNASGLVATITPGVSVTLASPTAIRVVVSGALTGACTAAGTQSESYAGKCITTVNVPAGSATTLPIQP